MFRTVLESVLTNTVNEFGSRLAAFAPNLLAMAIILVVGALVAGAVHVGVRLVLAGLGFDRLAARSGAQILLERGGIRRPASHVIALVLAWTVLAGFVLLAIGALNLQIAMDLVSRGFAYLPQVLIALGLLILGMGLGAFARRSVLLAAVNAGYPGARLLAAGVQSAVVILFVAMALEHLGVGRQILIVAFTIVFGGVILALALAFGLGGQELAREFLRRRVIGAAPDTPDDDARRHV